MSLNTKVIMDLTQIVHREIGKYSELIKEQVEMSLNKINIEEMILEITKSVIAQNINYRITLLMQTDNRLNEIVLKKVKESIDGVDIKPIIASATKVLVEDVLRDKFESNY